MGQQEVIQVLEKEKEWLSAKEIAEMLKCNRNAIQQTLKRMFPQDVLRTEIKDKKEGYKYKLI